MTCSCRPAGFLRDGKQSSHRMSGQSDWFISVVPVQGEFEMKMLIQIAAVLTLAYRGLLQVARVVASRTQVASWSVKDRQKGASALEYIMLAAVIVGLLVAVAALYGEEG